MKTHFLYAKLFRNFKAVFALFLTVLCLFSCSKDTIDKIKKSPAEKLTFQKVTEAFSSGAIISTAEIIGGVQGTKTGYTLKSVSNLDPNDIVSLTGSAPNFSLTVLKRGSFTATLVLEHPTKADVTITGAQFEITKGTAESLTFQKVTKQFSSGGKFTTADILGGVQGNKTGYTVKDITTLNPDNLVTVTVAKELHFNGRAGSFTATIILQHPIKVDVTLTNCGFGIIGVWDTTFGGRDRDIAYSIVQTRDGGYAVAGLNKPHHPKSNRASSYDMWVVKLDANGNKQWDKTFGGSDFDIAYSIVQTADGGYAVAGYTDSKGAGKSDMWVVKLDANGNKQWDKTFGGSYDDYANSIVQTADGGYAVAGSTWSRGAGKSDRVVKLDANGNKQWDKTFGGSYWYEADSIVQTADGGYAVAGDTSSKGAGKSDMWVVKLDANGNKQWDKTFGGSDSDSADSIVQTADGGYAVAGYTESKGAGQSDMWVVKLDANGNKQWDKTFGGSYSDEADSIVQTADGGYAVAGWTLSKGAGSYDMWVVKLDGNGYKQWDKTFGGSYSDEAHSIVQTSDGGYAVAGRTRSKGAGDYDMWVIKLDKDGNL